MHTDLQLVLINARGQFIKLRGCEKWRTGISGIARIIIQHQSGQRFHHAVHENLHAARMQHIALILRVHFGSFINTGNFKIVFLVKRNFHAGVKFALIQNIFQQLQLIPIAIHIMHGGYAQRIGKGDAFFQKRFVAGALAWRCRWNGVAAGIHP